MEATDPILLSVPTFGMSVRAMVAELDGVPVGMAGVLHARPKIAFANLTDEIRKYPSDILRVIDAFGEWLAASYTSVIAIADVEENNAPSVLERIGFKYSHTTTQGDVYRWHKPQSQ